MRCFSRVQLVVAACLVFCAPLCHADDFWGLKPGKVELKSAGSLAFGPDGIIFVGDTKAATVYAIATGDAKENASMDAISVTDVQAKLADLLAVSPDQVKVNDLAVNPQSKNLYLSVSGGDAAAAVLVRVDGKGKFSKLSLDDVEHQKVVFSNAPEDREGRRNPRDSSITDLAYAEGKVIVSGLATGEAQSMVRELAFPFADEDKGTSVEIYHAAHGRSETNAPIRTFVTLTINGEPTLLAGFTCTPLVKLPLDQLASGEKVQATTVAELGNRNQPLDMIAYKKDGKDYLLLSNSARGLMKISTETIEENAGLTEPVRDGGTAGQPFESIEGQDGIEQMDRLNEQYAVVLAKASDGTLELRSFELP